MRRKAAALAVGALFLAPAAHAQIVFGNPQAGTLQIYGKLYPQFSYATSKDASAPGTTVSTMASPSGICGSASSAGSCSGTTPGPRRAIDVQNSYIGFRGERDITNYQLKFIWQIEQGVGFDFGAPADNVFSNRNSFLGVRTNWGTVKLGHMDTIYKEYGDTFQMFGISSGNFVSASNILSQIGIGRSGTARFHERKPNSIQYESPQVSGFTAGYQYSPDEGRDTTGAAGFKDASLHSYGVKWDSEKLYLSVHGERHNDFFGGTNNVSSTLANTNSGAHSRDQAVRFSAEWRFIPDQRITLDIARMKWAESGQAAGAHFLSYQHTNWAIGYDAGFGGPWRFATQYIRGGEGHCQITVGDCTTTGLSSYMITAGTRYRFDRQTFIYAIAAKLNNGPSARYDTWAAADPARGADILQAAIGLSYSF